MFIAVEALARHTTIKSGYIYSYPAFHSLLLLHAGGCQTNILPKCKPDAQSLIYRPGECDAARQRRNAAKALASLVLSPITIILRYRLP
jgi:hypothetical protein